MNEEQDLEQRRTAYRQAGLAVARYTQGRPVPDLSLERSETPAASEAGSRGWEVDLGSRSRQRVELEIISRWVGPVAESRACFDDGEPPQGWGAVREPLADLGRRVTRTPGENDAYLEWLRQRAIGLINIPQIWAAIEALASALLDRGVIPSADASAIVAGVQRTARRRVGFADFFRNPR